MGFVVASAGGELLFFDVLPELTRAGLFPVFLKALTYVVPGDGDSVLQFEPPFSNHTLFRL